MIIDLFSYKVYGRPHKGDYGIVNCNPMCTYCPLVPKRDTFNVTYDGSPMPKLKKQNFGESEIFKNFR